MASNPLRCSSIMPADEFLWTHVTCRLEATQKDAVCLPPSQYKAKFGRNASPQNILLVIHKAGHVKSRVYSCIGKYIWSTVSLSSRSFNLIYSRQVNLSLNV